MKIKTVLKTSALIAGLGFASLMPAQVRAQSEVSPDQFPISGVPWSLPKADFAGTSSLPCAVNCSGKDLKTGGRALSVKSEGASRVVAISGTDASVSAHAPLAQANRPSGRSALLVGKLDLGRKIEGIYVAALHAVLNLENSNRVAAMEHVPVLQ